MPEQPTLIGVVTPDLGGYYIGAIISGIHQAARSAGVEVLVVQQALCDMRFPILGSAHVAGWVIARDVQCFKIVVVELRFGPFGHAKAEAMEDLLDVFKDLRQWMLVPTLRKAAGKRHIEGLAEQGFLQLL